MSCGAFLLEASPDSLHWPRRGRGAPSGRGGPAGPGPEPALPRPPEDQCSLTSLNIGSGIADHEVSGGWEQVIGRIVPRAWRHAPRSHHKISVC